MVGGDKEDATVFDGIYSGHVAETPDLSAQSSSPRLREEIYTV